MVSHSATYTKKQGFSALFLFLSVMLLAFIHGLALMSALPVNIIASLNFVFPLFDLVVLILFLRVFKDGPASIGLQLKTFSQSMFWGFIFLIAQLLCYFAVSFLLDGATNIIFGVINLPMVILFINSAFVEEVIYRGYIETRLQGLVANRQLCSIITAVLFVLAHYPVKWMSGHQLNALSLQHILLLVTLHFACSFTYRKSNCLWGAVFLHVFYNLANSILIFN